MTDTKWTPDKLATDLERELYEALRIIGGGFTNDFPGAPDIMAETPEEFRSKMWSWSQEVARAALAKARDET